MKSIVAIGQRAFVSSFSANRCFAAHKSSLRTACGQCAVAFHPDAGVAASA
jgi:hypothetical protein